MTRSIEKSSVEQGPLLKNLLLQPGALEYFPLYDVREVDDAVRVWEIFCKKGASLTAFVDGTSCGIAYLNIQAYKKFAHQCLITIIVDEAFRNRGVGTALMEELFILGRETFDLEILHLEVYETNPAINLYKRLGFVEFGFHKKFIKEQGRYIGKLFMERSIVEM